MIYAIFNNRRLKVYCLNIAWSLNSNPLNNSLILSCKMEHSFNNMLIHLASSTR